MKRVGVFDLQKMSLKVGDICLSCTGQKEKPAALILLCHLKDTESILLLKNSSYSLARQIPTDLIFI